MSDEGIVTGHELVKKYGGRAALDHVSFTVGRGEIVGFLGPNGAGKTTLIKLIGCVSFFDGGDLRVFGLDTASSAASIKSRIGVVPQENNLDPDFTVYDNLTVFARYFSIPRKTAKTKAEGLLRFVNLGDRGGTKVNDLSGGMKRRLIIARSLINDPELIILDEPTTGLDPQSRRHVWELVLNLKKSGKTVLLTTHYMEEAEKLCDRVYIMDNGRVLVEGSPYALIGSHIGRETVELSHCPEADHSSLPGTKVYLGDKVFVHTMNKKELLEQIAKLCPDVEFVVRPSNLEDLFIFLTGRELRE